MGQVRGETMSGLFDRSGPRLVPPVLSVVGCSGSGKTRLITALIPLLAKEGLRVGALKNAYSSFEVDRPGKDSWSMRDAGAASVVLASSGAVALMETTPTPWSLEDLVGLFAGRVDVVLAEGHGTPGWAVVEVWRSEVSAAPMLPLHDVLALVTDDEVLEPCRRISPDRPAELASLVLASIGSGIAKPEFRETASRKMVQKTSGFLEGLRRISSL